MTQFSRRAWLKTAGLTGAFTVLGGGQSLFAKAANASSPAPDALIRLSSNENPYGPSEKVRQAIVDAFDQACRYPYGNDTLVKRLAEHHGVSPEHIVISAGSTEGLKLTGIAYGMHSGEIVAADPTYQALLDYAEKMGAYVHRVPVDRELQHDLDAMYDRVTGRTSLVYLCNPNNPTGTILPGDKLRAFCEEVESRSMVFVDEAYFDFIEEPNYPSMIDLVREGKNVVVSRTFSKVFGLAGLRIGYLIARPDVAQRIADYMVAFTNTLALAGAEAALEDRDFYTFSLKKNKEAKDMIYATLDELGLRYVPSHSNFVFFHTGREIQGLIQDMQAHNVRIGRPFPPLTDWCRISTGTPEETAAFCTAIKQVLQS